MQWLSENLRLIIDIFSVIFVTIFFFIKKKPNKIIDTLKEIILNLIPSWINYAEDFGSRSHLNGSQKMELVIDIAKCWFVNNGFEYTDFYDRFIRSNVENILSTPQKKKGEIENGKE